MKNNQWDEKNNNKASPKPIPVTHENTNKNDKTRQTIKDTKVQ
ncbi:hypothetical protein SDC9_70132 [bioreactor metagenome]|uniref:Uncharacterized protein n=1 Tax=bioreactor metagenome TaxID=1076179 RepID=A0A644Y6T6_9ZZZZ